MTIGSPVASAVSGPGVDETNAIALAVRRPGDRLAVARQRRVGADHLSEKLRARAVRRRDDQAGSCRRRARDTRSTGRRATIPGCRTDPFAAEAHGLAVGERHHPQLPVRPPVAVVVLDDVGDAGGVGRELDAVTDSQLQQIARLQPVLRPRRRRAQKKRAQPTCARLKRSSESSVARYSIPRRRMSSMRRRIAIFSVVAASVAAMGLATRDSLRSSAAPAAVAGVRPRGTLNEVFSASRVGPRRGNRWWSHVEALANDGMEGRNTGSAGPQAGGRIRRRAFSRRPAWSPPASTDTFNR